MMMAMMMLMITIYDADVFSIVNILMVKLTRQCDSIEIGEVRSSIKTTLRTVQIN